MADEMAQSHDSSAESDQGSGDSELSFRCVVVPLLVLSLWCSSPCLTDILEMGALCSDHEDAMEWIDDIVDDIFDGEDGVGLSDSELDSELLGSEDDDDLLLDDSDLDEEEGDPEDEEAPAQE